MKYRGQEKGLHINFRPPTENQHNLRHVRKHEKVSKRSEIIMPPFWLFFNDHALLNQLLIVKTHETSGET